MELVREESRLWGVRLEGRIPGMEFLGFREERLIVCGSRGVGHGASRRVASLQLHHLDHMPAEAWIYESVVQRLQ